MTDSEVSRRTGVSRKALRALRQAHEPALQDVTEAAAGPDSEKKTPVLATVLRCYPINPRVLEARLKASGEPIRVRVRDNRLFVPGQDMPVVPEKEGAAVYVLACRQPVVRGRLRWEEGLVK